MYSGYKLGPKQNKKQSLRSISFWCGPGSTSNILSRFTDFLKPLSSLNLLYSAYSHDKTR